MLLGTALIVDPKMAGRLALFVKNRDLCCGNERTPMLALSTYSAGDRSRSYFLWKIKSRANRGDRSEP
jgi:hypothetical protein